MTEPRNGILGNLPCPFCGDLHNVFYEPASIMYKLCYSCGARGPSEKKPPLSEYPKQI